MVKLINRYNYEIHLSNTHTCYYCVELSTTAYGIESAIDYIHENPVKAGFVNKPEDYPYSNAIDFGGGKGLVHIEPCQFSYKLNVFWAQVENLRQSGAGQRNSDNKQYQFWQQHNQPIELSVGLHDIDAAIDYIHENPVKAGFVNKPEDYPYSSAIDFGGGKGLVNIEPC